MARNYAKAVLPLSSRLTIVAGGLGFAVLALGSGLDRAAARRPDLVPYVPDLFRYEAWGAQSTAELERRNTPQAVLQLGALGVGRAPIEGASSAVLGMGYLRAGDSAGAERAFTVSGRMGWRVPLTQTYLMMRGLELEDYRVAAIRLDAILRQQPRLASNAAVTEPFEQNPTAMDAMIDRMALHPNWAASYLRDLSNLNLPQLTSRERVFARLSERGLKPGCDGARPLVTELVRRGDVARARGVWRTYCPLAHGMLADTNLLAPIHDDAILAPFNWKLLSSGEMSIVERPAGQGIGQWLNVSNTGPLNVPVMRQMAVVPAGRYRISWLAQDANGTSSRGIEVQQGCELSSLERVGIPHDLGQGRWQAEVVIDANCVGHWFQLVALPGRGGLTLGRVMLESATGPVFSSNM